MIGVTLFSDSWPPRSKASHTEPSAVSLSPTRVHTWNGASHSRFAASAIPIAMGMPWPRDPVATSTHGSTGVG